MIMCLQSTNDSRPSCRVSIIWVQNKYVASPYKLEIQVWLASVLAALTNSLWPSGSSLEKDCCCEVWGAWNMSIADCLYGSIV
jgi:hypothetical protein